MHTKTWRNCPQKLLIFGQNFFFQYCQAQNQPKSHFLFPARLLYNDFGNNCTWCFSKLMLSLMDLQAVHNIDWKVIENVFESKVILKILLRIGGTNNVDVEIKCTFGAYSNLAWTTIRLWSRMDFCIYGSTGCGVFKGGIQN